MSGGKDEGDELIVTVKITGKDNKEIELLLILVINRKVIL